MVAGAKSCKAKFLSFSFLFFCFLFLSFFLSFHKIDLDIAVSYYNQLLASYNKATFYMGDSQLKENLAV